MIHLSRTNVTNEPFLPILERTLNIALLHARPLEVYVIQIDGWFDDKWQGFSGTVMHELAVWLHKLTVPPFHPSRVLGETHFALKDSGYESLPGKRLHITQPSRANLNRSITDMSTSAVFLWYSQVDENSDRSSLMLYTVDQTEASGWYAGFKRNGDWKLTKTRGAPRAEIEKLFFARTSIEQIVGPERR